MLKPRAGGSLGGATGLLLPFLTGLHPVLAEAAAYCVCQRLDNTGIISSLTVSEWRAGCHDKQTLPSLQLLGCCLKNGYEAIFFHSICTRIYNDTFITRHFLSALKATIARCLKWSHKVESGWKDKESEDWLQDPADKREDSFFKGGYMCFFHMISSRGKTRIEYEKNQPPFFASLVITSFDEVMHAVCKFVVFCTMFSTMTVCRETFQG